MYDLKQRIINGPTIYQNKTLRYLLPLMKKYGKDFVLGLSELKLKFCGIGDYNYTDKVGDYMFCVVEITDWDSYNSFLKFVLQQNYYIDDYIFSIKDNLHCFVFKFPFADVVEKFLKGKYSKMLTEEDINRYYKKTYREKGIEYYTQVYSVLLRKKDYESIFLKMVEEDFGTNNLMGDDFEYDYPPILGMEILNYDYSTG